MEIKSIVVAILSAWMISTTSYAAQSIQPRIPGYEIENTHIVAIRSHLLKRDYELYVKFPSSYAKQVNRLYPTIFLHDARYSFPLVSSLTRQLQNAGKIDELIIIGISYSKGDDADLSRTRDYTPTNSPLERIGHSAAAKQASGQADAYLRFLIEEVFPFVAKTYRTDMSKTTYAGHSFGGLFGAYVLRVAPITFNNYIISDPSLWYDDQVIFSLPRLNQARSDQPNQQGLRPRQNAAAANVLLVSSSPLPENIETTGDTNPFPFSMVGNAQRLETLLKINPNGYQVKLQIHSGEIHETIFPIAMSHGLLRFHGK